MKKNLFRTTSVLLLILSLLLPFAASCDGRGGTDQDETAGPNEPGGGGFSSDTEAWSFPDCGIAVAVPAACSEYADAATVDAAGYPLDSGVSVVEVVFLPEPIETLAGMTGDELTALYNTRASYPLMIFGIDGGRDADGLRAWLADSGWLDPAGVDKIGAAEDWTFFRVVFEDPAAAEAYEGRTAEAYRKISEALGPDAAEIRLSVPEQPGSDGNAAVFATTTLGGDAVDSADLFGENRITVVNLWASWCGPCVGELKELEALNAELKEKGCGVVGILCDGDDPGGLADAKEIIADFGLTYPMLMPGRDVLAPFPLNAYPTTYFVDSEGRIVGEPVVGTYVDAYRQTVENLLGAE